MPVVLAIFEANPGRWQIHGRLGQFSDTLSQNQKYKWLRREHNCSLPLVQSSRTNKWNIINLYYLEKEGMRLLACCLICDHSGALKGGSFSFWELWSPSQDQELIQQQEDKPLLLAKNGNERLKNQPPRAGEWGDYRCRVKGQRERDRLIRKRMPRSCNIMGSEADWIILAPIWHPRTLGPPTQAGKCDLQEPSAPGLQD